MRVEGTTVIRAEPRAFIRAFTRRIESGLLTNVSPRRNHYVVTSQSDNRLSFRAADLSTAFNVGLNDVDLTLRGDQRLGYSIGYRRWASYALILGAIIGSALLVFFLLFDARDYIARHPASRFPGLSIDQNFAVGCVMAVFWGFVWPWLLIGFHRQPLRKLMEHLVTEVDSTVQN